MMSQTEDPVLFMHTKVKAKFLYVPSTIHVYTVATYPVRDGRLRT
jgi:hypothetical protein